MICSKSPDVPALAQIAPMMASAGAHLCHPFCRAYHRVWGFFRLYGVLPAVGRDHDTLIAMLRGEIREGRRNVLVSGAADAGLLSYVLAAMKAEGVTGRLAVVDRCPTPLAVNAWYSARCDTPLETWCGPIQDYRGNGFDLVVAHNFFNSFDAANRLKVCRVWHEALHPGGRVAMIAHIKPHVPAKSHRFDGDRVEMLVRDALTAHSVSPSRDLIAAEELSRLIREFARTRVSTRTRSIEELRAPIEAAGLRIVELAATQTSLPTSQAEQPGQRYRVIAERPR